MPGYLDEYLVKLGFGTDIVGYGRFQAVLHDAEGMVLARTSGMAKRLLEFQAGVTGAFMSVAGGLLGLADNAAMADQDYRLLALHMYTSLPVARELKIAMDALGQPLENIAWDPELARRFQQLVKDQEALGTKLGPDFERQMLKIRDVRFEFTRFGVELKYLTFMVVKDLAKAFGTDMDDLFDRLQHFNSWLIENMPQISEWITTKLKPVLIDVKDILGDTWDVAKLTGTAFTNLIGILSGDKSLEGTTVTFEKMARALQTVVEWVKSFTESIIAVEQAALHTLNAGAELKEGKYGAAKSEMGKALDVLTPKAWSVPSTQELTTQMIGDAAQQQAINRALIIATAKNLEFDPALALAIATHESNLMQWNQEGKLLTNLGTKEHPSHAMGLFQLQLGTAKDMGVDPADVLGNITGGIKLMQHWMGMPGGTEESALEHYYGNTFQPGANEAYARTIMAMEAAIREKGDVSITINAPTGNALDIAREAKAAVEKLQNDSCTRIQRNLLEFSGWAVGGG